MEVHRLFEGQQAAGDRPVTSLRILQASICMSGCMRDEGAGELSGNAADETAEAFDGKSMRAPDETAKASEVADDPAKKKVST